MLRPNGEDFTKPLVQRSRPFKFGHPGAFPFPVDEPRAQPLGQGTALLEPEARRFLEESSNIAFEHSTVQDVRSRGPTAFVPDRIPGPVQFFKKLLEFWNLSISDATSLLGYESADQRLVAELLAGRTSLRGRDAKDRITALFRIRSLLAELFQSADVENAWLREPKSDLANRCPLDLLRDGSMENLLLLRQYVEHVSGL
jgi:hypothetical protein